MGCPLAAIAFALTLHLALDKQHKHLNRPNQPITHTTSYMDDITLLTHHDNLQPALDTITHEVQQLGLQLNTTKTECWIHPTAVPPNDHHQHIRRTTRPLILKATVHPTPVIPDTPDTPTPYTDDNAPEHQHLIATRRQHATRLQQLHDQGLTTHVAQALWRTVTAGDSTYLARATGLAEHTATQLDLITIHMFERWLNTTLTTQDHYKLFTGLNKGGLGMTSATHIRHTAFIASWQQAAPHILQKTGINTFGTLMASAAHIRTQLEHALHHIDDTLLEDLHAVEPTTAPTAHHQKQLTKLVRDRHTIDYTNNLDPRAMSVHLSTTGVGAGAWLHAPVRDIVPLTNDEFATATRIRLDKPHTTTPTTCTRSTDTTACHEQDNIHLDHALACKFGPYRTNRHNALRNELTNIITDITGQRPLQEQVINLTPPPPPSTTTTNPPQQPTDTQDTPLNRSDITFPTAHETYHLDIMVTSATTKAAQAGAMQSITPGIANDQAEHHKRRKYGSHPVTPIVFEAHGRMGDTLHHFLHQLAHTQADPQDHTPTYHYCLQRLATTLQRKNAQTLMAHIHHHTTARPTT